MLTSDIAIDFGTGTIRFFLGGKGIVISEPSVMAINADSGEIVAMGREAYAMQGRTTGDVVIRHPFVRGLVENYSMADHMVTTYIKKIGMGKIFLPSAVVTVPFDISEVEKHALSDIVERSGIRKITFIEESAAAAMGAGLSIKSSVGFMIVDLGQATTKIAVMAGNRIIAQRRIFVAGQSMNEALVRYIRKKHDIEVGPQTAESVKCEIGSVFPRDRVTSCHVKGKNIITGLPEEMILTSDETVEALVDPATQIAKAIEECLEFLPPEILGDISRSGITLTGGTANLYGLDKFLEKRLRLSVQAIEQPQNAVPLGAGKALGRP